ncbi:MAG: prohibitin family protein [Sheuella sp.]|nr:prohibitin family protein [Sheuella sp.]
MKYFKRLALFLRHLPVTLGQWCNRHLLALLFLSFVIVGGLIVLYPRMIVKIPAGYKGVIFRPFSGGVDLGHVYGEGFHFLFPFNVMSTYSIVLNVHQLEMDVLTSDLLKSKLKLSFQYSANEQTLPMLHRYLGADYLEKYILPELTASVREVFGKLNSNEAFTTDLRKVAQDISLSTDNFLINNLSPAGLTTIRLVRISAFQVEGIEFPPDVQASIENKIVLSNNAQAMVYKIQSTQQEASRKVIEGEGIKKFQELVNAGMTDNFLRHEGIEATRKLAESNNAKVVVFGTSNGGLPLILGDSGMNRSGVTKQDETPSVPSQAASSNHQTK